MSRRQLIIDTETTSLQPDYAKGSGVIWELAIIDRADGTEHVWRTEPDLAAADPGALQVGRYYERTAEMRWHSADKGRDRDEAHYDLASAGWTYWSQARALAAHVAPLLSGATLIAANPTFDAGFLAAFLRWHGQAPSWHYRLRDIGSMAYAWLHGRDDFARAEGEYRPDGPDLDAGTDDFARALGVEPDKFERHSALGDCRLVAAMLDVIEGRTS